MADLKDGAKMELVLQHGAGHQKNLKGTLRSFRQNADQIADLEAQLEDLKAKNDLRWEIIPDDGPAVGFLAEHIVEAKPLKMN